MFPCHEQQINKLKIIGFIHGIAAASDTKNCSRLDNPFSFALFFASSIEDSIENQNHPL